MTNCDSSPVVPKEEATSPSNWTGTSVRTSYFIADNQTVLLSFFLFFFSLLPKHCTVSGIGKLWTQTTFIVHCQCLTADTDLVASVGCSSASQFVVWLFFCAVAGLGNQPPTGLSCGFLSVSVCFSPSFTLLSTIPLNIEMNKSTYLTNNGNTFVHVGVHVIYTTL